MPWSRVDVALIGVEPGTPGEPQVFAGSQLLRDHAATT
jgi:hypothetical protein